MSEPRLTSPLASLLLAIAGTTLVLTLPSPLKLLLGGPLLALGAGFLLRHAFRGETSAKRAMKAMEDEVVQLRARAEQGDHLRRGILAYLREGVVVFGEDRRVLLFNPAAARLLGSGGRLDLQASLPEVFREPEALRQMEQAFAGDVSEWTLRRELRALRARALPFQAGLEASGVLVTLDDVTRMEALETTRQKFISNASHELKTPVTSIRVATENLQDGELVAPEGDPSLRSILRAVDKMTLLINDITELSRIETGALVLESRPLPPGDFAQQLLEDLEPQARPKSIRLVADVDEAAARSSFRADPLRLHQLLENLLSNAIKFSPDGSEVRLVVRREGTWLLWRVEDQGPGIPQAEQQRIFERFYRAASVRGIPGTGLGLAIVKHLAKLMGGEIGLESEPGKGSTFIVKLPIS